MCSTSALLSHPSFLFIPKQFTPASNTFCLRSSTSFMGGLPSKVASTGRRSTMKGKSAKTAFSLSATQKVGVGSSSKTATERSNWETATDGQVPHFASFSPPQDWERHDLHIAKHPYASAGGEESFVSVNEKADKDTGTELPTFVSYVLHPSPLFPTCYPTFSRKKNISMELKSPPWVLWRCSFSSPRVIREDGSKAGRFSKHGSPGLNVKVEVIEMKESITHTHTHSRTDSPPSSSTYAPTILTDTTASQQHYPSSADDIV